MLKIDLNCDMGESYGRYEVGNDRDIMPLITSCNIACGFHGGDPSVIIETIQLAHENKVKIGAHPSYPDLQGFGRRRMHVPHKELVNILQYQIAVIDRLSEIYGNGLHHVKPHGALYNHAFEDESVASAIVEAMNPWPSVILYAQFNSALASIAIQKGLTVMTEGFADRRYSDNLNLMSRQNPDAVHTSISTMVDQVIQMVKYNKINTKSGSQDIHVDTICIHGDHDGADELVKSLSTALRNEGISIQ